MNINYASKAYHAINNMSPRNNKQKKNSLFTKSETSPKNEIDLVLAYVDAIRSQRLSTQQGEDDGA